MARNRDVYSCGNFHFSNLQLIVASDIFCLNIEKGISDVDMNVKFKSVLFGIPLQTYVTGTYTLLAFMNVD